MEKLFIEILNMTLPATLLIIALMVFRRIFNKLPKNVNLFMWAMVFVRLLIPIKIESSISLTPRKSTIPENIMTAPKPEINSGIDFVNNAVNPILSESFAPNPGDSANPMQVVMFVAANIWVVGIIAMIIYALISFILLKRKVSASVLYKENIYYCDYIESPFVLGIIKPKIYLPSGISEKEAELVILHEKAHIKRFDHITKMLGFFALSVHWFNPFVWAAYLLFARDIESAADEKVIKKTDLSFKKEYSETLLNLSSKRTMLVCPLAFGEIGVKERVKSVLSFKKPTVWVIILSITLCAVLIITFMTVPKENKTQEGVPNNDYITTNYILQHETMKKIYPEYYDLNTEKGLTIYVWQFSEISYYCGILEGKPENHNEEDIYNLQGAGFNEIKIILSDYDLSGKNINVVPFNHPASSYKYEITPEYKEKVLKYLGLSEEVEITRQNWFDGITLTASEKINNARINNDIILEFHIHPDLKKLDADITTDKTAMLQIYLDGKWVDYGVYQKKNGGYNIVNPEYQDELECYYFDTDSNSFNISAIFDRSYGELIPGTYRVAKMVKYEERNNTKAESYGYSAIFSIAEKEILSELSSDKAEEIVFKTDVEFIENLRGELIYRGYGEMKNFYKSIYTDGSFTLQIKYGEEFVDYEKYMQKMGYDYAKPEFAFDGILYQLSFDEYTKLSDEFQFRVPFDVALAYGNLVPGNYRIVTVMNFELISGEVMERLMTGEFAVLD